MPEKLEELGDEFIPQFVAREYLDIDKEEIAKLIKKGKVRKREDRKVSLIDLNRIKFKKPKENDISK